MRRTMPPPSPHRAAIGRGQRGGGGARCAGGGRRHRSCGYSVLPPSGSRQCPPLPSAILKAGPSPHNSWCCADVEANGGEEEAGENGGIILRQTKRASSPSRHAFETTDFVMIPPPWYIQPFATPPQKMAAMSLSRVAPGDDLLGGVRPSSLGGGGVIY